MKKKILLILLLLIPFMVSAKENYSYDWAFTEENNYIFAEETNDGYTIISFEKIKQYNKSDGAFIKEFEGPDYDEKYSSLYTTLAAEIAKLVGYYIQVKSNEFYKLDLFENTVLVCPGTLEETTSTSDCTEIDLSEADDATIDKYAGVYAFVVKKHNSEPSNYHYGYYEKGYYFITTYDPTNDKYYFEIYNGSGSEIVKIEYNTIDEYYTGTVGSSSINVLKTERDYINNKISYKVIKYSLSGKEIYTQDISSIIKQNNKISTNNQMKYTAQFANMVNSGMVVKLYNDPKAVYMVSCMSNGGPDHLSNTTESNNGHLLFLDDPVTNQQSVYSNCGEELNNHAFGSSIVTHMSPLSNANGTTNIRPTYLADDPIQEAVFVKLNIEYEIEKKVTGNGTITITPTAGAGQGVTIEVKPDKGYVLSEIKVIDEAGNIIKVTDYKFTMPTSNVLVEAVFIENPDTGGGFISALVIMGALLLATLLLIFTDKKEKIKMIS